VRRGSRPATSPCGRELAAAGLARSSSRRDRRAPQEGAPVGTWQREVLPPELTCPPLSPRWVPNLIDPDPANVIPPTGWVWLLGFLARFAREIGGLTTAATMLQAKFEQPAKFEHEIPGSCEVLIGRLLHRLRLGRLGITSSQYTFGSGLDPVHSLISYNRSCHLRYSSKESSLQGLQDTATCTEVWSSLWTSNQQEIG
jgi:hypothetical protein